MSTLSTNGTTVADRVAAWLADTGIRRVYVYPGGTIAPLVNGFVRVGIPIEVFKHEQGAAYAALAEARLTGKPQVVMVTSGPGVTNVITPLADAYYDSTPVLFITGQIGTGDLCSGRQVRQRGFQEVPTISLVRDISKAAYCPLNANDALKAVPELMSIALAGRQGPVVLDFPMDVQRAACSLDVDMLAMPNHAEQDVPFVQCAEISAALAAANRPVILLGHGALRAVSFESYRQLAERADALVVSSLPGLGAYPTNDSRFLGYIGHTGHEVANKAVHQADFLLALGTRLDVRQTGTLTDSFVPTGQIAWVNNDPDELAYARVQTKWSLVADVGECVRVMLQTLPNAKASDSEWLATCKAERLLGREDSASNPEVISPKEVLRALDALMSLGRGVVTTGVGCHQQWAARHLTFAPNHWRLLTSAGHGAMGYDLPSAIGAALTCPGQSVLCVVGDGSLLMNIQELASLAERKLPVKVLVLNNSRLGIVSQFQKITWDADPTSGHFETPDFAAIAHGFGVVGETVVDRADLGEALKRFWEFKGPALLDVRIDHHADVVPMLLAGQAMDSMWQGYEG